MNPAYAEIVAALELVETALGDDSVQGAPAIELVRAAGKLRRARDLLRPPVSCTVCDDEGCPYCPNVDNVVPLRRHLEVVA